jgi:hypothetical protein
MGFFTNSEEETRLPSCNFHLKKRLDEPAQFKARLQFGQAQQPIRTNPQLSLTPKEQGIMGKLDRIATGVFETRHNHVGAKRCYVYKISKGGFIKVTIGIAE